MTYKLHFLPQVEEDVVVGYKWYEEKKVCLGEDFLRMFYACTNRINLSPFLYRKVYGEFRRCLLRRFPYTIYFKIEDELIVIFGIFHSARNPKTIRMILLNREEKDDF
ncbi:MAG: type II toxin-antitoxin system RelE/ParE family toxin [bacterium]